MIAKDGSFFSIFPSKFDFSKINGLFGNYNSNQLDDIYLNENQYYDTYK